MDLRARRSRETSPGRVKFYMQPKMKPFKKVQIVYYLCRNGQLEHPHFMEVYHNAGQQLRLKDVLDRLTVLRGRGMPSLFCWSCKRSYKNGYVWNDVAENDVIYPAEGAEYVLKGSEIIEGCADRFQQLQITNRQKSPEFNFYPKPKQPFRNHHQEEEEKEDIEEEEEKGSDTSSNAPYSRCSRGVSTDEIHPKNKNNATELPLDDNASPPSTCSTLSEKANQSTSQRFDETADGAPEPTVNRKPVLLQLIACGAGSARVRNNPVLRVSSTVTIPRKSSSLHKEVLCKTATKFTGDDEISYMSENPRFGNPQSEEKEYFSGSIVESMTENRVQVDPVLKKSSSYKEERSSKSGMVEELEKKGVEDKSMNVKCIPKKRLTCCKHQKK